MGGARPGELARRQVLDPWAVAAALVRGRTDPSSFDAQALADERIRRSRAGSRSAPIPR